MSVIFILLPLAFLIAAIAVGAFIWAARDGQLDDLDTPPARMLFDDEDDLMSAQKMKQDGRQRSA